MPIQTFNDLVRRAADGYTLRQPVWGQVDASTAATFLANNQFSIQRVALTKVLPSLPSGVTGYIVSSVDICSSSTGGAMLVGELINLGTLDISGPTFTDGNQMPTLTSLGSSRQLASAVLVEVTAALNATPGNLQITYVDQDGNTAESNTAQSFAASAISKSVGWVELNAGDWGVRDITSATRTGGTTPTGTLKFWGVVPLGFVPISPNLANQMVTEDFIVNGTNIVRMGAGDEIGFFSFSRTASNSVFGAVTIVGDE